MDSACALPHRLPHFGFSVAGHSSLLVGRRSGINAGTNESVPCGGPVSPGGPLLCELPSNPLALCLDKDLPNLWLALVSEREAIVLHQLAAVRVGEAIGDDANLEGVCELTRVDQFVEFLEGVLVGDFKVEIAPAINIVRKALEVADAGQDNGIEPLQEVVHEGPKDHGTHAARIADTEPFLVVVDL